MQYPLLEHINKMLRSNCFWISQNLQSQCHSHISFGENSWWRNWLPQNIVVRLTAESFQMDTLCFPKLFSDLAWFCADFTQHFLETGINKTKPISEHPYEIKGFSGKHLRAHNISPFQKWAWKIQTAWELSSNPLQEVSTTQAIFSARCLPDNILLKVSSIKNIKIEEHVRPYSHQGKISVQDNSKSLVYTRRSWGHVLPQHVMQLWPCSHAVLQSPPWLPLPESHTDSSSYFSTVGAPTFGVHIHFPQDFTYFLLQEAGKWDVTFSSFSSLPFPLSPKLVSLPSYFVLYLVTTFVLSPNIVHNFTLIPHNKSMF